MAKTLVVVESPAKVRTIKRYIGSGYEVKASMGHVKDLPKTELGVDVENDFTPKYVTVKSKGKILKEIKEAAKKSDRIFLALDPDREGEAIAWHISREIGDGEKGREIYRVLFNEITKPAITEAFANPGHIDIHKVDAQQARRILDRLVGYKLSPLLWSKIRRGLSAGRVQSVALRIICDREEEINNFVSREYWSITASLEAEEPPVFEAKLNRVDGKKADVKDQETAQSIVAEVKGQPLRVSKLQQKERRRNPAPPFTTSTFQQEAFKQLRFRASRTMAVAQRLYEGLNLGDEGPVGLITYMRTDSIRVSKEAQAQAREFIIAGYGKEFVPKNARVFKSKKSAQEAHEAIRPSLPSRRPEDVKSFLKEDEFALYRLIWNRFMASQMSSALYDVTTADIEVGKYEFRATGSIVKFAGFTTLYVEAEDADEKKEEDQDRGERRLPPLREGLTLKLLSLEPKQHFTQPPPRYSEATLIKELEEKGIGRPSTYTSILNVIQNRDYVEVEQRRFKPTPLGIVVTKMLVDNFPTILDAAFTARMEEELDRIESGQRPWRETLSEFYTDFLGYLEKAKTNVKGAKGEDIGVACVKCESPMLVRHSKGGAFLACSAYPKCKNTAPMPGAEGESAPGVRVQEVSEEICEKCGNPMMIKEGRYGKFLACSEYPECKNTRNLNASSGESDSKTEEPTDRKCEKCGSPMVVKEGRYGKFLACSKYPECKNTKPLETGMKCPQEGCGGAVVPRRTKKGRVFYGCSNYPKCRFAAWDKPVEKECPQCDSSYLLEKYTQKEGKHLKCPNKECGYMEHLEEETEQNTA